MGAWAPVGRAAGTGAALLVVLLCCCCAPAKAQNYTALRGGVWLPPQCGIDNVTEARELSELLQKLPQVKGTSAEQQLRFLSAGSRSKLNNLTGNAAEWLRNRTDTELEQLFEGVRGENFRRMMALGSISTQLRKAFTSVNVLRSLEFLQTQDLERLASLPLFDERYQRLTNVTFLQLIQQLYNYGLTQVPQRTCVLTAANTSDLSRLPTADANAAATAAATSALNAIKTDAQAPVISYQILNGRRRRSSSHRRRSLLDVVSDTAHSWFAHADYEEAAAAVVRAVTQGPGLAPAHVRRMLLQATQQPATGMQSGSTSSVAPIVSKFIDTLQPTTAPDGSTVYQALSTTPIIDAFLLQASPGIPGIPTQPGFLDSRAVSSGVTENLGLYRFRNGGDAGVAAAAASRAAAGGAAGSTAPSTSAPAATTTAGQNNQVVVTNCSAGLVYNGSDCVPCAAGTVLEGSACVCANGTAWNATLSTCLPVGGLLPPPPCVNGTLPDGRPCPPPPGSRPPCVNGSLPNGTLCTVPRARGIRRGNMSAPLNSTVMPTANSAPYSNATVMPFGQVVNNASVNASAVMPAGWGALNASGPLGPPLLSNDSGILGAGPGGLLPPPGGVNGTAPPPDNSTGAPPHSLPAGLAGNGTNPPPPLAPPFDPNSNATGSVPPGVLPPPLAPGQLGSNATGPLSVQPPPLPAGGPAGVAGNVSAAGAGVVDAGLTTPATQVGPVTPAAPSGGAAGAAAGGGNVSAAGVVAPGAAVAPAPQGPTVVAAPPAAAVGAVVAPGAVITDPAGVAAGSTPAPVIGATILPGTPAAAAAAPSPAPATGTAVIPEIFSPGPFAPTPATPVAAGPVPVAGSAAVVTPAPATPAAPAVVAPAAVTPTAGGLVTPVGVVAAPAVAVAPAVAAPAVQPAVVAAPAVVTPPVVAPPSVVAPAVQIQPAVSTPAAPVQPAAVPLACVGSWVESGACSAPCEGTGTKTALYTITTPASGGGAACEAAAGATKQVPCTDPTPCPKPPVNCVGAWGPPTGTCDAPCEGTGTLTSVYTVTTPAANGGAACEAASGATKPVPCTNPTPCPKPVACVGSWGPPTGTCNAPCEGTGTQTSIFTISTPAANGGAACEAAAGATKPVPCTNPTPCPKPVACVGAWGPPTGTCNAPCEGVGTQTSIYSITTPAANGGAACEAASGATRQVPCSNPTPCPKPVAAAVVAPSVAAPVATPAVAAPAVTAKPQLAKTTVAP